MGWNIVPDGLREMLLWISSRYNNPLIYITENGSAEAESEDLESALNDERRRSYFSSHLNACANAIKEHQIKLAGYFAWSFMDNFEWQFGYQRRFGMCHVNFTTLERTPRTSALWYRDTILSNGRNIQNDNEPAVNNGYKQYLIHRQVRETKGTQERTSRERPPQIPAIVLIGYGSNCDAVRQAIYDGVNIVIWSFLDVVSVSSPLTETAVETQSRQSRYATERESEKYAISTTLNLTAIRNLLDELYLAGYSDILHFASVGGWNGGHLDTDISAFEWYRVFNESVGDIFDGIDWDLEGNDLIDSPDNFFTLKCLDFMGTVSRLTKEGMLQMIDLLIYFYETSADLAFETVIVFYEQTVDLLALHLLNLIWILIPLALVDMLI
jgi:Glycosyl hydrolase family 1